jgi:nicotinate-nucleotide--dimethylbenzimidazole phosphoribosyltransferase
MLTACREHATPDRETIQNREANDRARGTDRSGRIVDQGTWFSIRCLAREYDEERLGPELMWLDELINRIGPLDEGAMQAARERQDSLTKPRGSLGRLETLSIEIAGMTGRSLPKLEDRVVIIMAGDHGVVAEGVSAYPQAVTAQMLANFCNGGAAINVLARQLGARLVVVDIGVSSDVPTNGPLIGRKVATGTGNMVLGPAMSRGQALHALQTGSEVFEAELARGLDILALGEMGIGNTTSAAAIASCLTGRSPEELVGRGTGVDSVGLRGKVEAVERATAVNRPDARDPIDVLAKVGGFEIAGLAGAALSAAAHRRPVMVDGFPATAAAMVAVAMAPRLRPFLIAAHRSEEKGHTIMLDWLGLRPLLDLGMRLGEGTGAVFGMTLADAACRTLSEMATFEQAGVSSREEPPR